MQSDAILRPTRDAQPAASTEATQQQQQQSTHVEHPFSPDSRLFVIPNDSEPTEQVADICQFEVEQEVVVEEQSDTQSTPADLSQSGDSDAMSCAPDESDSESDDEQEDDADDQEQEDEDEDEDEDDDEQDDSQGDDSISTLSEVARESIVDDSTLVVMIDTSASSTTFVSAHTSLRTTETIINKHDSDLDDDLDDDTDQQDFIALGSQSPIPEGENAPRMKMNRAARRALNKSKLLELRKQAREAKKQPPKQHRRKAPTTDSQEEEEDAILQDYIQNTIDNDDDPLKDLLAKCQLSRDSDDEVPIARNPNGRGFSRWDQDEDELRAIRNERKFIKTLTGDFDLGMVASGRLVRLPEAVADETRLNVRTAESDDSEEDYDVDGKRTRRRHVKKPHKPRKQPSLPQIDLMIQTFIKDKSMAWYASYHTVVVGPVVMVVVIVAAAAAVAVVLTLNMSLVLLGHQASRSRRSVAKLEAKYTYWHHCIISRAKVKDSGSIASRP
jgi:hypothetical protein